MSEKDKSPALATMYLAWYARLRKEKGFLSIIINSLYIQWRKMQADYYPFFKQSEGIDVYDRDTDFNPLRLAE
jgi:hypothetical protein